MVDRTGPGTTHDEPERTSPQAIAFTVFPLRFSADPAALIAFLRTLGMTPLITTEGDGFADLVAGGGGRVMVHGAGAASATAAPAGETQLSTAVRSVGAAAEHLRAAGLEVTVWDESYGHQGNLTGPHGEAIGINEDQADPYGYVLHDGSEADPRLSVTAVRASAEGPERDRDIEIFAALGFVPVDGGNHGYRALASPGHGSIGLHEPSSGMVACRPGGDPGHPDLQVSLVRLGFETSEDLDELAARLSHAGYPAHVVTDEGERRLHVTDPDGQVVEVHPRSAR
ncbi:VOC family protein [Brachybacterium alimentarium]|uniref:VOC family protein n=1 Tax=Brachybacterium alimentarium TaxID=47845 RepID=UPI003FD3A368